MRRPLLVVAFLFGVGTWIGLEAGTQVPVLFVLCVAGMLWLLCLAALVAQRSILASSGIWLLVLVLGMFSAIVPRGGSSVAGVSDVGPGERVSVAVQGMVVTEPVRTEDGGLDFVLQADRLVRDETEYVVHFELPVRIYGRFWKPPRYGEIWAFTGRLRHVPDAYRGPWWFAGGVRGATRQAPAATTLAVWAQQVRRSASATLRAGLAAHEDVAAVVQALLLGYRARLPEAVQAAFRQTGTMHVFAISGLHVGILCAVLVLATNLMRVPRTSRVLVLGPVILFYAFVTGARASAVRAGLMAIAYLGAPLVGRRGDTWSAVAFAALVILCWQPEQLIEPGFIFSFTAVAGILLIVPLVERGVRRGLPEDPFALRADGPKLRDTVLLWFGRLVAVSVAAWLSTAPLSMYYFGRFALVALLANLLVLPLTFLIVVTGVLALLGGALAGGVLASVFNHANILFVHLLVRGIHGLQGIPGGHIEGVRFPLPLLLLWYAVLLGMVWYGYRCCRKEPLPCHYMVGDD